VTPSRHDNGRRIKSAASRSLASIVIVTLGCAEAEPSSQLEERRAAVAETGATVMGFDLDASTHVFERIEDGGLQQVFSDTNDPDQIRLIREHVSEQAERFSKGDFHDPETIHGEDMAGLHDLVVGHDRISIEYAEIDRGAQIVYTTDDPDLVAAIHTWFEAQLSDHGDHARHSR